MRHKEIEAFHPSCLSQTKENIRHLLSLTTTNHNYNVDARTYTTSGHNYYCCGRGLSRRRQYRFALCIFNNRVFRLFRVAFDTRYPNISSYIPFLAVSDLLLRLAMPAMDCSWLLTLLLRLAMPTRI